MKRSTWIGILSVLGLTAWTEHATAGGIDRFAWPVTGDEEPGKGFDHDPVHCAKEDETCDRPANTLDLNCGKNSYDSHSGTDLYAPEGDEQIYAAAAGVVVAVVEEHGVGNEEDNYGFGNAVVIYHGDGLASLYAHLKQRSVLPVVGSWVECGEVIAEEGNTGNSTDAHLHFDVRVGVTPSNEDLGGYLTGTKVDPFLSTQKEDGTWCGASSSMWVEETQTVPSRTCDEDEFVPTSTCHSGTHDVELDEGGCVQISNCAWRRCIGGVWIAIDEAALDSCTSANHALDSCEAIDCADFETEASCGAWPEECDWSCATESCVAAGDESCAFSCDDGEQNGEETDVDCGGPDCLACDGDPCTDHEECASTWCEDGVCDQPPFDCHTYDGEPDSCENATGCVYHECASSCSPNTETACEAGCADQCGEYGCVSGTLDYISLGDCVSGPASGIAQLYRYDQDLNMSVLDGMVGINTDGSFCADLSVGENYYLWQELEDTACGENYIVGCYAGLAVGAPGVDGVCAASDTCEDLGELEFDCGS